MKHTFSAIALAIFLFISATQTARAELPSGVADVVLGDLDKKLNNIIERAEAAGDHLIKQLAVSAQEVIRAWEKSNAALLKQAFSGIDESTRRVFNNIDSLADRMLAGEEILMQDAEDLTSQFASAIKNFPLTDKQPEVYSYSPKVLPATGPDLVRFRIVGPKLGTSNPAALVNGDPVAVERPTDNEIIAVIERSQLKFGTGNSIFAQLRLDFDDERPSWWGRLTGEERRRLKREMAVWLLPTESANWNLAQSVQRTNRETMTTSVPVGGRGKDSPYHIGVRVPPHLLSQGWRLDQSLLVSWAGGAKPDWQEQGPADHGTCAGLVHGTTSAEGFTYNIQMGHVTRGLKKHDAWGSCTLTIPLFREVTSVQQLPAQSGSVSWTDDAVVNLDSQVQDWQFTLKMFDGRTFIVTPNVPSPPSDVKVNSSGGQIHMRPRTPQGF